VKSVGTSDEIGLTRLVRRILAGDLTAETELVDLYQKAVSIVIDQIVRSRSATEDVSQETFKLVIEKIRRGEVRDPERLSGFIRSVARNLAVAYQQRARHAATQQASWPGDEIPDSALDPLDEVLKEERCRAVRRVINEMKIPRDREILFRYCIAEEDKDIICSDLGLTRTQFNSIFFRALGRFKELFEKLGGKA
jgi:RNA polymerase sigma-70 factor, ECF subfamily